MSARKLGRAAGLVFVLAVLFGGAAAGYSAAGQAGHAAGGSLTVVEPITLNIDWD